MASFCVAIRKDSLPLLRFPFLSHVQVFLCVLSLVCHLKYPYTCFSFHLFLVIFVMLTLTWSVLLLVAVISLPPHFFMESSSCSIDASMLSSILASLLPPSFLYTYNLSTSFLGCNALCIIISFLVLLSISFFPCPLQEWF